MSQPRRSLSENLYRFYSRNRTVILILADCLIINLAILITFLIRFGGFPAHNFIAYKNMFVFIILIRIACFYYFGLYSRQLSLNLELFYDSIISVISGTVLILAVTFINRSFAFPRTVTMISLVINIAMIYAFRYFVLLMENKKLEKKNVLIIGFNSDSVKIASELEKQKEGFELRGFVSDQGENEAGYLGPMADLKKVLIRERINLVIITGKELDNSGVLNLLFFCESNAIEMKIIPNLYEILIGKSNVVSFISYPLIEPAKRSDVNRMNYIKRIIDFFISLVLLIFLTPMLIVVAILIKLDSKGPVLFLQRRVGLGGKEFVIFKFRSMVNHAERNTGPVMASENDSRVTRFGKVLRKYRLDELPQLFNVLIGDMSIVGPRPERNEFVKEFSGQIEGYTRRFAVRPGITGLAQVVSGYDLGAENKLRYDLAYVSSWNFFLDFKIMIETIKVITFKKGAC